MNGQNDAALVPAHPGAPAPLRDEATQLPVVPGFALPGLFQETDPEALIGKATYIATRLADIVEKQEMFTKIGTNKHLHLEGFQTLGAFMGGIMAFVEWSRYVESRRVKGVWGYEARATARFMGLAVTAAEASCWSNETKWANKDEFELKSMAQTRASSKALGLALRWVVKLAGYSGTGSEEIDEARGASRSRRPTTPTGPLGRCALHNKDIINGKFGPYCPTKVDDGAGKKVWCKGESPPEEAPGVVSESQGELPDPATFKNLGELFTTCQKHLGVGRPDVLKILGISSPTAIGNLDDAWYAVLATKQGPPAEALPGGIGEPPAAETVASTEEPAEETPV